LCVCAVPVSSRADARRGREHSRRMFVSTDLFILYDLGAPLQGAN